MYAAQGYDTAQAIAAALQGSGGNVNDAAAFRKAMLKADFASTRGTFKFGANQHPVQDWWAMVVDKDEAGKPSLRTRTKLLSEQGDPFAAQCKLRVP